MSNYFHVNPKEEILNQMREELRERAKRELFLMELNEIKRAVKYFSEIKNIRKKHIGSPDPYLSSFYDLAINALEKQMPKTPMQSYYSEGDYTWECVNCEETVDEGQNYCHHCGQKLLE